jgi:hypothetical protein
MRRTTWIVDRDKQPNKRYKKISIFTFRTTDTWTWFFGEWVPFLPSFVAPFGLE